MSETPTEDGPDEFAGMSPAAPRSPILALTVIALSAGTMFHLRADLQYALSPRAPVPVESLDRTGALDAYAVVHGIPDRRDSLFVEARGAKSRETFFRLLDADPPIFVRAADTAVRPNEAAGRANLASTWRGRLRRFDDVPYAASLRDYLGKAAETTRYLDLTSWKASLASRAALHDRSGRAIDVPATTMLTIEKRPTEYALEMPREKFPGLADAQHELERILAPTGTKVRALDASPDSFRFATPIVEDATHRNELFALLEHAEIDVAPEIPRVKIAASAARLDGDALVAGDKKLAWADIVSVSVAQPLTIDGDALVLTEGETPAGFLWAPLVAGLLFVLALFNAWYLLRPRRAP